MEDMSLYIGIYYIVLNAYGGLLIRMDKQRAIKGKWRIPEKKYFRLALLGGGVGVYLGMKLFKHKTRHNSFKWGIPTLIGVHIFFAYFIFYHLGK